MMGDNTSIEWTDATFNPWIGCTKVGPGCDHCYAEADMDKRRHRVTWGPGQQRSRTSVDYWKQPLRWNRALFGECQACGWRGESKLLGDRNGFGACPACDSVLILEARRRVFCASLADVFDNEVPPTWRMDLFSLIRLTPNLDWLLLTKRIGNAARMIDEAGGWSGITATSTRNPLPNVWLGATVVNQEEADRDVPKLLRVPARRRFLSIEPMLGPIDVRWTFPDIRTACCHRCGFRTNRVGGNCPNDGETLRGDIGIDWVICGGESGHGARPMHPDWARSLRDQCAAAGVPFLFKQWGEWTALDYRSANIGSDMLTGGLTVHTEGGLLKEGNVIGWTAAPEHRLTAVSARVGKKAAGRLLDGIQHNGFPSA